MSTLASSVHIQLLRPGDEAMLQLTAPGVFDRPVDPKLTAEFLADSRHHIVVAIENDVVIGFASGVHHINPDKPAELWISEVGVAELHQRRGIAKAVLNRLLQEARTLGCVEAWVLTNRSNAAAMRLYSTTGGSVEGHEPDVVMFTYHLVSESSQSGPA